MTIAAQAEGTAIGLRMPPVPCAKAFCPKCTIAGAAAHAGASGNAFFHEDATAKRRAACLLQSAGGAHAKVFFHVSYDVARTCDFAARVKLQNDVVAQINQHEHGFKQMHAVGALPHYVQKKVEFGRSLEFERRSGHGYSMTRVRVICLGVLCESVTSAGEPSGLRRLTAICHPDCVKESSAT